MIHKITAPSLTSIFILCFVFSFTSLQSAQNSMKEDMTNFTVVEKPPILLVGIQCKTSNAPEQGPHDIPRLWGKFYGEDIVNQIPNKISHEVIALYCDYEGDYTQPYSVVIGCPVLSLEHIPEGMVAKTIPEGTYAVFRVTGDHPQSLIETWGSIWQMDLDRTYTGDYEIYGEQFISDSSKEVNVYIAIQKKSKP